MPADICIAHSTCLASSDLLHTHLALAGTCVIAVVITAHAYTMCLIHTGTDSLLSGPINSVQQGTQQVSDLHEAIELNLARALMQQRSGHAAVEIYRKLASSGEG